MRLSKWANPSYIETLYHQYESFASVECILWNGAMLNNRPVVRIDGHWRNPAILIFEQIKGALETGETLFPRCRHRTCLRLSHQIPVHNSVAKAAWNRLAALDRRPDRAAADLEAKILIASLIGGSFEVQSRSARVYRVSSKKKYAEHRFAGREVRLIPARRLGPLNLEVIEKQLAERYAQLEALDKELETKLLSLVDIADQWTKSRYAGINIRKSYGRRKASIRRSINALEKRKQEALDAGVR